MKKTKSILISLTLEGEGLVNYEGSSQSQKKLLKDNPALEYGKDNNFSYAKKNFYKDAAGKMTYKPKISSDCLRNSIFKSALPFQTPNMLSKGSEELLYAYITSPSALMRGYCFAAENGATIKRKSPFTLTAAESNNLTHLEVMARSGDRNSTSFFYKETSGEITYEARGIIDLHELQFISCDSLFDRAAFSQDLSTKFLQNLKSYLPSFQLPKVTEDGYVSASYAIKTAAAKIPEVGVLLGNEEVNTITKELLKNILNIQINRATAYVKTSSLKIKLVNDPLIDTYNNLEDWIEISSEKDIDNLTFDTIEGYVEVETVAFAETVSEKKPKRVKK